MRIVLLILCFSLPLHAESFASWVASYSLTGGDASATADPDDDGVLNLMEYAIDGMSPVVPNSLAATATPAWPRLAFVRRTGTGIGAWEFAAYDKPPTNGAGGKWHSALIWQVRPNVEGIRFRPQVTSNLIRWHGGRGAIRVEALPGNVLMAVALTQGNRFSRSFLRLKVVQDANVGNALAGLAVGGLQAASLDTQSAATVQRVTVSGSTSTVTDDDISVLRTTGATAVTDVRWLWTASPYNVHPVTVTRTSSDTAVIEPHATDPYLWTWKSNGSATLRMTTETAAYTATVTTSTATGATVDVWQANVSGSLRAHLDSTMDARIAGTAPATAMAIYTSQNHGAGTYVRNASCWAAGADLTPISPWNSAGGSHCAGTLISPCHVMTATHYSIPVGATIRFVAADNTVVTRTVSGTQSLTVTATYYPDITILKLDSDVPGTIGFARVLPSNWSTKFPNLASDRRVAALILDQEEKALIADWYFSYTSAPYKTGFIKPVDAARQLYYEDLISGDSGNPGCLIVNDQLVLLTIWTSGGAGSGTSVVDFTSAINSAMTTLGGGYSLTSADLSGFTTF